MDFSGYFLNNSNFADIIIITRDFQTSNLKDPSLFSPIRIFKCNPISSKK